MKGPYCFCVPGLHDDMMSSQVSCEMPWSMMTVLTSDRSSMSGSDEEDAQPLAGLVVLMLICPLGTGEDVVTTFSLAGGTRFVLATLAPQLVLLLDLP